MEVCYGQIRSRRYRAPEKTASLRQQRVGGSARRSGFPAQMHRLRASDHDCEEARREKHKRNSQKRIKM